MFQLKQEIIQYHKYDELIIKETKKFGAQYLELCAYEILWNLNYKM